MLGPRNRELIGLIPSALLVTAGFAAIFIQSEGKLSSVSLTYGAAFLALCLATHLVIRRATPFADPYLFPLAAVLSSIGLVELYRISNYPGIPNYAREQGVWMVVGLLLFSATIIALRDGRYLQLENYRYLIAIVGVGSLLLPRLPGIGQQVNGAYLSIHFGSISFEPAEFGKIAIVIFLASYLRDNRQLLVTAGRRILWLTLPPMKQFGPLLLVWGSAMGVLLITREIGTSLMFFGAFLALLYVATGRFSFPFLGLILFAAGAYYLGTHVAHIYARVLDWEHPFDRTLYLAPNGSYQLAQALFAQADGGIIGTGFDQSILYLGHGDSLVPIPQSDMIYSVITDETGLVGATGLLVVYALFVARGLKIATLARDSFSKLLATGLAFVVAVQVFVIVGGVTDLIPLTGVTLPFVAYGGSSIIMNFVLLALLLLVSDRARRPVP
ncbi:MAG TPA: FtsW/RodA/SpoVE family cell cycle protein [Solirubrobacteraceae bacterium]|nr:FtsW/RodA/SpoVE family cell cycle protein [Solirubrobacteraceae bacterium]